MDAASWNSLIASLPGAHLLQTWQWGHVKLQFGWKPVQRTWEDEAGRNIAAALVLQRDLVIQKIHLPMKVLYVPKGPLCFWEDVSIRRRILADLVTYGKKVRAIFIKIDPDVRLGTGIPGYPESKEDELGQAVVADLHENGWLCSNEQIQFRNTIFIDLKPDLENILYSMKQKTRYNIRLAEHKGVIIRAGNQTDFSLLYRMFAETSARDGFVIREEEYYRSVWSTFVEYGMADILIAEVEGEKVSALLLFRFGGKAWYLYGMSFPIHREKMPNHLLQWEAIKRAKAEGCGSYDLWGAPDVFNESDPLWRVYRFKEGFGGKVVRHIGAWDYPVQPLTYKLYTRIFPRILDSMRKRGKVRVQHLVS